MTNYDHDAWSPPGPEERIRQLERRLDILEQALLASVVSNHLAAQNDVAHHQRAAAARAAIAGREHNEVMEILSGARKAPKPETGG